MRDYTREILIAGANQVNLSPSKTQRLLQFVENWIALNPKDSQRPSFDTNYAETWANRFKKSKEYVFAVGDALFALVQTDGERKAQMTYTDQLIDHYGHKPDAAALRAIQDINEVTAKYGTLKGRKTSCMCKKSIKKPSKIIGKLPNFDANFRKLI